jgi:hypothetical protein
MVQENPNLKALIASYPEDQLDKIIANKEKLFKVISSFTNISRGGTITAMVMVCQIDTCPYRDVCVLRKNDIAPVGGSCPVEKKMVMELESDIIDWLEIDKDDPIEMELLWDLIDTKILDLRASAIMRNGEMSNLLHTKSREFETLRIDAKPELFAKIELKKIKHSIIDSFVASRKAKKKYGMNSTPNTLEDLLRRAIEGKQFSKNKPDIEDAQT